MESAEEENEDDREGLEDQEEDGSDVLKRRGRCPITGIEVAPGELRRVLV